MRIMSTLLLIIICAFSASSQSWKITSNYSLGIPQKDMGKNIQPAHSLQGGALYQLPGKWKQLAIGAELGLGFYASKRIEQTFQFDNNTSAIVPVNYSSNTFNGNLRARLNLLSDKNLVIPYINVKAGIYNFFSTITIEDPDDPLGCHALQRKNIMNDITPYWSAGVGLQIDPVIFSKNKRRDNILLDISINTIQGGTLEYINTKHLIDAQTANNTGGKPLEVQFINVSTQAIHEHTVAQVYISSLRMLEIKAGVIVRLGWN